MIIPLQNFLVIEQETNEMKMSPGGIWIPEKPIPEKQFEGTIVAKGPYVKDPDLKIGTRIALNAWGQVVRRKEKMMVDDKKVEKEYILTREVDIIAILKDEPGVEAGKIEAVSDE